jgi:hypothetical protein
MLFLSTAFNSKLAHKGGASTTPQGKKSRAKGPSKYAAQCEMVVALVARKKEMLIDERNSVRCVRDLLLLGDEER